MTPDVKLEKKGGVRRVHFDIEDGEVKIHGNVWISYLPSTGVIVLRVEGPRADIAIEDYTR